MNPISRTPFRLIALPWIALASAATLTGESRTTRPMAEAGPTEVKVQMVMINLEDIQEATQSFTANFAYGVRWQDPRLEHPGPGGKTVPLSSIWHPGIQLLNQQSVSKTLPDEVLISPDGEVQLLQRVWGNLSQPLELDEFPFDKQEVRINLVSTWPETTGVRLVQDDQFPSFLAEALLVPDWSVENWRAVPTEFVLARPDNPIPGFQMTLDLKRNYRFYMMNLVLPLVMIVSMSWIVFWISPKNANPRISVSVTSMLTLIAYRFAIRSSLPQIGYLTHMDWFILGSSLIIFFNLIHVVTTSWMMENGREDQAQRFNRRMRVISPAVFVVFCWLALTR